MACRGPQTPLLLTPPAAGYPKHPRGFDQGLQGPLWAGLMGHPTCRRGGLAPPSPSGQNSGEEGSPCSFGPVKPPIPSAQLLGEHPAWGAAQEPLSLPWPEPGFSKKAEGAGSR